jgi:HD superfamily phosphodiesterase
MITGRKTEMINRLHLAMINLYTGDPKRIQHFCKVYSYAGLIAEQEGVDENTLYIIEAAAITHDIGIHLCEEKYGNCNGKHQEEEGPALAKSLLQNLGFDERTSERVQYLIGHHHTYTNVEGIDYQILIEADFLVNLYEDAESEAAVKTAYDHIFKTETGRKLCREMFALKP